MSATRRTPIVIGNWKMNGLRADGLALMDALLTARAGDPDAGTLGVCPPATLLTPVAERIGGAAIRLGGQDCAVQAKGAFTGDLSASMLADAGAEMVIVGHSERRQGHGESDAVVKAKANAALAAGLEVILCIGETEAEWTAGRTLEVLDRQIEGSLPDEVSAERLIVAYEPVWAIGTGRTPGIDDIARTHAHLRGRLAARQADGDAIPLLYGGSVKPDNAGAILGVADVDGALVGGASLDADQFWRILEAGAGT